MYSLGLVQPPLSTDANSTTARQVHARPAYVPAAARGGLQAACRVALCDRKGRYWVVCSASRTLVEGDRS